MSKFVLLIAAVLCSASASGAEPEVISNDSADLVQEDSSSVDRHTDPVLRTFIESPYPQALIKKGIEGTVSLDISIDAAGRVDSVVLMSGVNPILDSLAMEAAYQFEFTPATVNDVPEAVILSYGYTFSINQVLDRLKEYTNFTGILREYGTRNPIANTEIAVGVNDAATIDVPLSRYLEKIGTYPGQQLIAGRMVTRSDSEGRFTFTSMPTAACNVVVESSDYVPFSASVNLRADSLVDVQYWLERTVDAEYEITVYGKNEHNEVTIHSLPATELGQVSGAAGDAVKAIQALPGVARPLFGGGEIVVRGGGINDNRFFCEGVELPYLYHTNLAVPKSVYNTAMLSTLDFYPGGYGVRYGDVMGGVIEITGRAAKTDRKHASATLGFPEMNALVEGSLTKNTTLMVSATRSYLFEYAKFIMDTFSDEEFPLPSVPSYWDMVARIETVKGGNRFFGMYIGSGDVVQIAVKQAVDGSEEVDADIDRLKLDKGFHGGIFGWDARLSDAGENRLRVSGGRGASGLSQFGLIGYHGSGTDYYLRDEVIWKPSGSVAITGGIDCSFKRYTVDLAATGDSLFHDTSHYRIGPYAAFALLTITHGPLTITPGLRYDYYPQLDYRGSTLPEFWNYRFNNTNRFTGDPSARMTLRYRFNDAHTLKGGVGTYNQAPRVEEGADYGRTIVPMLTALYKKFGNPQLPSSKANHVVLGNEWKVSEAISLDISGYYNRQWDLPRYATVNDYLENPESPPLLDNGRARMFGIELFGRYVIHQKLSGWLSYTLGKSQRYNFDRAQWELSSSDTRNDLQCIANYDFSRLNRFGMRLRYTDGFPTTPITGVAYDATEMRYIPVFGKKHSKRQIPFIGLDLRIERRKEYKWFIVSSFIEVTNVVHLLTFIKDKNGHPIYNPGEFDLWSYDYTEKATLPGWPYFAMGQTLYF